MVAKGVCDFTSTVTAEGSVARAGCFQFSNPRRFFQSQKETAMIEEALRRESRKEEEKGQGRLRGEKTGRHATG